TAVLAKTGATTMSVMPGAPSMWSRRGCSSMKVSTWIRNRYATMNWTTARIDQAKGERNSPRSSRAAMVKIMSGRLLCRRLRRLAAGQVHEHLLQRAVLGDQLMQPPALGDGPLHQRFGGTEVRRVAQAHAAV